MFLASQNIENIFDKIMVKKLSNQTERKDGVKKGIDLHHKLLTQGNRALTEVELITLVLNGRGKRELSTDSATKIFNFCENQLHEFSNWSMEDLKSMEGLDEESCVLLMAVWELSNRRWKWVDKFPTIQRSQDAQIMFAPSLGYLTHEEFYVAYLNRANKVISQQRISSGGTHGTVVDLRIVFQKAILLKASAIIAAHNHPSGSLKPSNEDRDLTKKLKEGCQYFDIQLLDHVILSGDKYVSFADEGWL